MTSANVNTGVHALMNVVVVVIAYSKYDCDSDSDPDADEGCVFKP
jgi:hypothetical protein